MNDRFYFFQRSARLIGMELEDLGGDVVRVSGGGGPTEHLDVERGIDWVWSAVSESVFEGNFIEGWEVYDYPDEDVPELTNEAVRPISPSFR